MSLQVQKELELKAHEQLYNNIFVLTLFYPPSESFNNVFKKDMFLKNNKAAFQQVIYYLLNVLDPVKFKEKVNTWPIFEVKMEAQFRNEIIKYLNEISMTYEDSDIPPIMPSHLISPGGFKFVKFMLKLSQFVLLQHLKRDPKIAETLISPIKPSKNVAITKERLDNLNSVTQSINENSDRSMEKFKGILHVAKEEADKIIAETKEADKIITQTKVKCKEIKDEIKVDLPNFDFERGFCNELNEIKQKVTKIECILNAYKKCKELVSYLSGEDIVLDYNKEAFVVPIEMQHSSNKPDVLIFKDILDVFAQYVNQKRLKIKPLSDHEINDSSNNCNYLLQKIDFIHSSLNELYSKLITLSEQTNEEFLLPESRNITGTIFRKPFRHLQFAQVAEEQENTFLGESTLAIPLDFSLENKENL